MVAKGSPDLISAGWTVQYRAQKTGRQIRFYKHMETGRSFVSKDEVIRYMKCSSLGRKPVPTVRNRRSRESPMHPTTEKSEYPSWLPDGWNVEMKTRMSGQSAGHLYKCYIDPMTGNKFYSKPDVFRYLRTIKRKSRNYKQKETNISTASATNIVVEQYKEADLPQGWMREIKIKKNEQGTRRDSFYTDPVTGYTFRSKQDVFRYLETGKVGKYAFRSKKRNTTDLQPINDKSSSTTKRQKIENTSARKQLSTDKISLKSSPELLEGERKRIEDDEMKTSPQNPDASGPKTMIKQPDLKKEKRNLRSNTSKPEHSESNPGKILESEKEKARVTQTKPRKSKKKQLKDLTLPRRSSKRLAGKEPECMPTSESSSRAPQVSDVKFVTLPDLNLHSDSYADKQNGEFGINPETKGAEHGFGETTGASNGNYSEEVVKSCENKEQTTSPELETEKVEFSVPMADFFSDPCLEFAIKTLTGALPVMDAANNEPDSVPTANNSCGKIVTESCIDQRTRANPKTLENKYEPEFEPGANSMIAMEKGCQEPSYRIEIEPVSTTMVGEPLKKIEKLDENQAATLTEHRGNETAESNLSFPYGFSWSDPCLDFAFKTLTGSIPVDDSLGIQTFFQEKLETTQTQRDSTISLPDFGSSSYFQNDISSSQFGPAENSGTNSSILPMGNVSLPGFGTMPQAQLKGNKGSEGRR